MLRRAFRSDSGQERLIARPNHASKRLIGVDLTVSGPKGANFRVVSAAELERRAVHTARLRLERLSRERELLFAEAHAAELVYGAILAPPLSIHSASEKASSSDLQLLATNAERDLAEAAGQIHFAIQLARSQQLISTLTGSLAAEAVVTKTDTYEATVRNELQSAPAQTSIAMERSMARANGVERALARMNCDATEQDVKRVSDMARSILQADTEGRADLQLRVLQDEVMQINVQQSELRSKRAVIDDLCCRLEMVDSDDAKALLARVDGAAEMDPEGLQAEVVTLEREAIALADRQFAMKVTAECLSELGYEVEPGFETVAVEAGSGLVRRTIWPGYALQVRASVDRADVAFNIVRIGKASGSDVRDTEVERQFCDDFAQFVESAEARGLKTNLTRHEPPGAIPLQTVAEPDGQKRVTPAMRTASLPEQ